MVLVLSVMQLQKNELQGGHSILYRACAFIGGSYFSLLLLTLELATIAVSIGILIVYGVFPTPDPRPFNAESGAWVWVSTANSSHVAITVRLFGGSESLFICKTAPTTSAPCSSTSALQVISIPVAADGSGLFKTIVGGLDQGTRYYYQVASDALIPLGKTYKS